MELIVSISVVNPCHICTDLDPWTRTTDFRIWIRILLFSSGTFKMPTKFFCLLLFERNLHESLKFIKMSQNYFCLMKEGSGSVQLMMDPDPGGPKTYRFHGSGSTTLLKSSVVDA